MTTEIFVQESLIDRAHRLDASATALEAFSAELPGEDDELAKVLREAVDRNDETAFANLLFAALGAGREVDAAILERGAALLYDPSFLASAAMHCTGDVPGALVRASLDGRLGGEREVVALLLAYAWCERHRDGAIPMELRNAARLAARTGGFSFEGGIFLALLAEKLQYPAMIEDTGPSAPPLEHAYKRIVKEAVAPPLSLFTNRPAHLVHSGSTMRRATPRVGRNDPCPCGSGKKYKRCCHDQDQERLRHSSDVAGVTHEEIREHPELYLTQEKIAEMRCYELARIDPAKVDENLLHWLVQELLLVNEDDAAFRVFETRQSWPNYTYDAEEALAHFLSRQRDDLAAALVHLPGIDGLELHVDDIELGLKLAEASDSEVAMLAHLEAEAHRGLRKNAPAMIANLAYALLDSRFPALGILVARGQILVGPPLEQDLLIERLLQARNRLGLPVDDPVEQLVDETASFIEQPARDPLTEKELERTRSEIREKESEVQTMQKQLNELRHNLKTVEKQRDRERERAGANAEQQQEAETKDREISDLRTRLRVLKSQVKERHEEKQQLRDELGQARRQIRQERKTAPREESQADPHEQTEENLFEESSPQDRQPPRIPHLTERFQDSLDEVPEPTARKALRLLGQLAAGDQNAFHGTRKLKLNPKIIRQRVGRDHRFLFRIDDRTLVAEALINRRDLERTIETLR